MIILVIRLLGAWAMPRKVFLYTLLLSLLLLLSNFFFRLIICIYRWVTTGDDEEQKLSLRDEELMADLTMDELKQAFR